MADLTDLVMPRIKANRLPGLDLGAEFIYPDYAGGSVLNIPSSICRIFEAPDFGAPPLHPEILSAIQGDVRRVVFILVDALSLHRMRKWLAEGLAPVWKRLEQQGLLAPLTSIVPSTTASALTSLWTGRSTSEHGIAGYELWLKEFGIVANMITHQPMSYQTNFNATGLESAGFRSDTFLPFPTLGTHLAKQGIRSYAFQHFSIASSGLSRMFFKDVKVHSVSTATNLWIDLRQLMESQPGVRLYAWVYWGEVDHLSHFNGPDDERPEAEFISFSQAFEHLFLNRLSAAARRDTLVVLTADHGQITTDPNPHYDLRNHPSLTRRLHIQPTGENRLAYLYIQPGQSEAVHEYLERTWHGQFLQIDPAYALSNGLFGPGRPHPRLPERLGDNIVVSRGQAYLWWADKENLLIGRHGGLSAEEMLVPFLAAKL
jgi:predicted AlkP superfamily pyrophosphatase or phosphodiesterase